MMNLFDWEVSPRKGQIGMRRHQDWMGHTSATHGPRTSYQYRADTLDPPNRLGTVQSGPKWEKKLFGPNGKPFGTVDDQDQEDRELTRKLKELREIEESIRCKKSALACKTELEPAAAADEEADGCSLRDRVAAIFQQRHSGGFLSKSHPHAPRMRSCDPRKEAGPEEDHPLKVRVKALMKHRTGRPRVPPSDTKVCWALLLKNVSGFILNRTDASFNVPQPPPRRIASPPAGGSGTDQGFQRFLDVLNRGVDVNLLRRIVNGDPEDARLRDEVQDQQRHRAADPPFPIRIQRAEDGISLPERSGSGERSRDPPGSSRIPDENREEALSPARSKTPPDPPSGIRHQKEDEERIKHDQQHEQLRNILTSLGLQLEVEEISRLADRTQERLYGKKSDGGNAESRREPDRRARHSPRSNRSSSSSSSSCSSSSSSSSRSSSRSRSSSSSRSDASGGRSSEKPERRENNRGGEKRPKISSEPPPFGDPQTYACPPPNPGYSFPLLADYSVAQSSQYSSYSTNPYQDAASCYWTYSQVPVLPSFYPGGHPYTPGFPMAVPEHPGDRPRRAPALKPPEQRCLKAVRTEEKRTAKKPRKTEKLQNGKNAACCKQKRPKEKVKVKAEAEAKVEVEGEQQPATQKEERVNPAEKSHDGATPHRAAKPGSLKTRKHRLSEEEIKANLRKTLEAFNRKVKQGVKQPLSSLSCQSDEDLLIKL